MSAEEDKVKITLKKSIIGSLGKHKLTVKGLGLRKINHSVVRENSPQIRGMIKKVSHLVKVEKI